MKQVEERHGVVTSADLIAIGLTTGQVAHLVTSGRIERVGHGRYRIAGTPRTFAAEAAAALRDFAPEGLVWLGFDTAARIWTVPVIGGADAIEVVRPYGTNGSRHGVIVHRTTLLPAHHLTTRYGLPLTSASRTLFDVGRRAGHRQLARAVRHAVYDDEIDCSIASLYQVLYDLGGRGRPGTRRMRAVLDEWHVGEPPTESVLDEIGRALLRDVPGIRWQVQISDAAGYIRRVDAVVDRAGLVIEFDGRGHDEPDQRALDLDGDRRLAALGYVVRRLRWDDVTRRGDMVHAEILHVVARAAS